VKTTGMVTKKLSMRCGSRGKKVATEVKPDRPKRRIPRITKLMALAIKFDQMIRDGVVKNQAELAKLGFVTRARVTQIMNLLNLAPAIQESLLDFRPVRAGEDEVTERETRHIVEVLDWRIQLKEWAAKAQSVLSDSHRPSAL